MLHSNCRPRKCCISELEKLKMDNCISHQYRPPCKIAIEQHAAAARITSVSILNQFDCCLEVVNDKSSNQSKGDSSIEFSDDYDFLLDMESVGKSHTVEKANIMTKHLISSHANFVDGSDNLGEAQASSDDDNMPDLIPHKVVTVSKNSNEASESLDNNDDMPNFIPHKVAIKSKKSFNSDNHDNNDKIPNCIPCQLA